MSWIVLLPVDSENFNGNMNHLMQQIQYLNIEY